MGVYRRNCCNYFEMFVIGVWIVFVVLNIECDIYCIVGI